MRHEKGGKIQNSTPQAAGLTSQAQTCYNCTHSEPLHGSDHVTLICANHSEHRHRWYAVDSSDVCTRFRQTVDIPVLPAGVRAVPLTQGKFALVDADDYAAVMKHSWYAAVNTASSQKTCYAVRKERGRTVRMHRQIMSAAPGQVVDHINHDGLDNRRSNLRLCTPAQNARNQRGHRGRSSKYKGVSYLRRAGKWLAHISRDGKNYHIGLFESEHDAARAYNTKASELFGEFAYLNKVDEASCFVGLPCESR